MNNIISTVKTDTSKFKVLMFIILRKRFYEADCLEAFQMSIYYPCLLW